MHRNVLLHGSPGRDCFEREQSFRYRCFGDAILVQLLLRCRHASDPVATAFRVRTTGDQDPSGGSGFCVKLDLHIPRGADYVSWRKLYILGDHSLIRRRPISIGSIGWKTYLYFAIFNFMFIPAIYLFCEYNRCISSYSLYSDVSLDPETRNLSLEEIDCLFTGPKIVMHIEDAEIDPEMMRPQRTREAEIHEKLSVERVEK